MRHALIAVLAAVGFGSGIAFAEAPKAPACEAATRGVMWNFGTDAKPDVRRCDGISYVPFSAGPVAASAQGAAGGTNGRDACMNTCTNEARSCESSCGFSFIDTDCRSRCQRTQSHCETKC